MHDSFPHGAEFFIALRDTNLVLDVAGGNADPGTAIILYTKKSEDNDNQKWIYENNQLKNKQTGLVLTFPGLDANVTANQNHGSASETQRFDYYDYTISSQSKDELVIGINGAKEDGAPITLIKRDNDSDKQQWEIKEY
ncbi:hypothetical protein BGZ70_000184 [Mortierella alpina]|uniref:Ricin B lectin domain-containing protein n=1 Tax=Mortierella alpina TaxID=64518 RepID=A0A9P6M5E8_MORAP|nr:hypothetical protein BGZ70_000184 [Mortierella alpina]